MGYIKGYTKFPIKLSMEELECVYSDAYDCVEELFEACICIRDQISDSFEEIQDKLNLLDEILFYCHNACFDGNIKNILTDDSHGDK